VVPGLVLKKAFRPITPEQGKNVGKFWAFFQRLLEEKIEKHQ